MKTVFIIAHKSPIDGPIDYFGSYLERTGYTLLTLTHPLDSYADRQSEFSINRKRIASIQRQEAGIFNLCNDFILSMRYLIGNSFDVCIGANNFDTLSAIVCRDVLRKKIKKIIYFASDFSESRFHNILLDTIYYGVERIVLHRSDLVISNTKRSERKRRELGLHPGKSIVIPNGVFLQHTVFPVKRIKKKHFVYVGAVTKEHGLYEMINTIHSLIDKLVIIGQGDDWGRVLKLCKIKKIHLETHYHKEHEYVIDYLKKFNGIGLAPYNLYSKWTYYCSPLKVNEYIACGVPVLISTVPEISEYIEKNSLGIVYNSLAFNELKNKLEEFDTKDFYKKAKDFYSHYNYDYLYNNITI